MKIRFRYAILAAALSMLPSTPAFAAVRNVLDHGASGTMEPKATAAIQAAIDECHAAGGGTVLLPAGDYLSGALTLKSNVTLHLETGATLYASTERADYPSGSRGRLLNAEEAENIAVTGRGTIHGQAEADYGTRWGVPEAPAFRTGILLFKNCRDIAIRDVTILYSDSWTLHLKRCQNAVIDGVAIFNNVRRLNSDGIDPNSCDNVRISNCHIVAGDDCIVFKATGDEPCQNIVVTNCVLETTTTALKLGTESVGGFRNIRVSNCVVKNTRTGIGFFMKDGSVMERVTFSNISIESMPSESVRDVYPIFMDIEPRHADTPVGTIRDVTFRDIHIESGSGVLIQGMPESPIENLTLENITLRATWADNYFNRKKAVGGRRTTRDERDTRFARQPAYIAVAHAKEVALDNIRVYIAEDAYRQFERSALYAYDLENFSVDNLYGDSHDSRFRTSPAVFENCKHGVIAGCAAPRVNTAFLRFRGPETFRILVAGNELSRSNMLLDKSGDIMPGEIKVMGNFELMSRYAR